MNEVITFTREELTHILRAIFRNDSTCLEHHQRNRFGDLPPVEDGRQTTRWCEPKEIARQIAIRKLGTEKFLWEPAEGCEEAETLEQVRLAAMERRAA